MLKWIRLLAMLLHILTMSVLGLLIIISIPWSPYKIKILGKLFGWPAMKILGFKIVIEGDLGRHHPCIYISNHQSNLDLFIFCSLVPPRTVSLGKKSLRWIPLFGQLYWFSGNILIDRGNRKKAFGAMAQVARNIVQKKVSVWMFPEGTRSKGRGLLPFKKGAFYTSIQTQRPLVPVVINSYIHHFDFNRLKQRPLFIRVLDPISTVGMNEKDIPHLQEKCFELMNKAIEELDHKVLGEVFPS